MDMQTLGSALTKIGTVLAVAGGLCFAGIFLIVLLNGSWPDFLEPVRSRYEMLGNMTGGFAFIIELIVFVGPGLALVAFGENLRDST